MDKEYVDLESRNCAYGEKINYVAVSPDGSIVATFIPCESFITIKKVMKNEKNDLDSREIKTINIDDKSVDKGLLNILGWSLAVSDIIDDDICFVAISCITEEDMYQEENEKVYNFQIVLDMFIQLLRKFVKLFVPYCLVFFFLIFIIFLLLPIPWSVTLVCLFVLFILCYFIRLCLSYYVTDKDDVEQFRLSWISSEGTTKLFKFSFDNNDEPILIHKSRLGGVIGFLKKTNSTPKNSVILVCMNYIKIQKINIKLNKNSFSIEENSYLLPENLFKELENIKDAKLNWKYLAKSRYQEFLIVDTNYNEHIQNIEIYNIITLQLVNVFYRCNGEGTLSSRDNEPGIFAISDDSRLFAYSCGDDITTIYLMESGLEIVSKTSNDTCRVKFLGFFDDKLFIIEERKDIDESNDRIVTCHDLYKLGDTFSNNTTLSNDDIDTILKYDARCQTLTKINGEIVFVSNDKFISKIPIKTTPHDTLIDEQTYGEYDCLRELEPWNNSNMTNKIRAKFLNDNKLLLIIGRNSIQLWKHTTKKFKDFESFRDFENSNLVYIFIHDNIKEKVSKFQIDDKTAIITDACKSLVYLYNHSIHSKEKYKNFIRGTRTIIKNFIKDNPEDWKLLEVQYPLMAYLIYSRSFSLIKHILFDVEGHAKDLHRPQNKYVSYPYYDDSIYHDFRLENDDLNLKSANDLKLTLKFCQGRDAVMLAYLLEYYSLKSMNHIGWMINVTKLLPKLSADYIESLHYLYYNKPCKPDGETKMMEYKFPIRRFKISEYTLNLKIYMPLTQLIPTKSSTFFEYQKIRDEELSNIYVVPNFTTYDSNIEEKPRGILRIISYYLYYLGKILLPPNYKNLENRNLKPFLSVGCKSKYFDNPVIEAVMTSRWEQAKIFWMIPLIKYIIFLFLFSFLSQLYLSDDDDKNKHNATNMIMVGIFYYVGLYLLKIEFMQMKKYKIKYFTLFNVFDLCSITLGIIVFTLLFVKSFGKPIGINDEDIVILVTTTILILWAELLLWLRLFTEIAIIIYIFGNILKKIIPFIAFMLILCIGFGHSMFVLFGHPSLLNLDPSPSTFTLNNGTDNLTLTGQSPDNPFDTIWDAILSAYYWNTINLNDYNYGPLKIFAFIANFVLVLVLLNMIIALMNDTFNRAKEDGNLGLVMFRAELIDEYERFDNSLFRKLLHNNSSYICFYQNPDIMENWMNKTEKSSKTKLYSWFNENKE
ncbi:hypothetical protein RclHR1_04550007 [Rhizophagus clarus]|uniref:Ion transport domain-containing protein n=1 Tax=Rhizophagus clarus TaxID=94130 RepID=A0A2Z6RZK6_9GLOM|nr:hypothetical protein RclHR1_04550007 [Rhizophagus clarus]